MAFDPESFFIEDALATSQDVYEVQFPSWGVRTAAKGPKAINPNFQFPPPGAKGMPSLAAIAIGSRSTVDRCWVSWSRLKTVASIPGTPESNPSVMESKIRQLCVDRPISFAMAGTPGILPSTDNPPTLNNDPTTAMHNGFVYAFPKESGDANKIILTDTTILPAKYADQAGNVWPLASTPDIGPGVFIPPYLELLLYLTEPKQALPTARFPQFVYETPQVTTTGSFQPIIQMPVFGRKHIGVGLRNATQIADYRIGFIRCIAEDLPPATSPPFEVPAPNGTATGVAANASANFQFDHPNADYMVIYMKVGAASFVDVRVAAYD